MEMMFNVIANSKKKEMLLYSFSETKMLFETASNMCIFMERYFYQHPSSSTHAWTRTLKDVIKQLNSTELVKACGWEFDYSYNEEDEEYEIYETSYGYNDEFKYSWNELFKIINKA